MQVVLYSNVVLEFEFYVKMMGSSMYMINMVLPFFLSFSAERLCCPHFKFRACGCLQSYVIGDGKSHTCTVHAVSHFVFH